MYPFIRMFKEYFINRTALPLSLTEPHVSHHICWPWDIDLWMELNNGRTLTLYDLGRIPLARRVGLIRTLALNRWNLAVAGCSMRWRRRVRAFDRVEMHSRCIGWDERFLYIEQSMWKSNGDCANQILIRAAVSDKNGIVSPLRVISAMAPESVGQESVGLETTSPVLPDWVQAWIEADAKRPWPPQR